MYNMYELIINISYKDLKIKISPQTKNMYFLYILFKKVGRPWYILLLISHYIFHKKLLRYNILNVFKLFNQIRI